MKLARFGPIELQYYLKFSEVRSNQANRNHQKVQTRSPLYPFTMALYRLYPVCYTCTCLQCSLCQPIKSTSRVCVLCIAFVSVFMFVAELMVHRRCYGFLFVSVDSPLAHRWTHTRTHTYILANPINIFTGLHDSLFVAVNVDDISCLHMAISPLLR